MNTNSEQRQMSDMLTATFTSDAEVTGHVYKMVFLQDQCRFYINADNEPRHGFRVQLGQLWSNSMIAALIAADAHNWPVRIRPAAPFTPGEDSVVDILYVFIDR